jgi:hypothetical protein
MSSTDSSSTDSTPTRSAEPSTTDSGLTASQNEPAKPSALRQQPIPPASEPMQYRAIGLIRGKYVASEQQFTRGDIVTDDGVEIGAVLLGRVMSLVKKHLDLEQSHLWVVYPRTREKGDGNLHVQIVGVWEPENLNRDMEASEPDLSDEDLADDEDLEDLADEDLVDENVEEVTEAASSGSATNLEETALADAEVAPTETEAELDPEPASELDSLDSSGADTDTEAEAETIAVNLPEAETPPDPDSAASIDAESTAALEASAGSTSPVETGPPPADNTTIADTTKPDESAKPSTAANDDLDDRYFSVRGEVIYQSIEEKRLLVKIRRAPRPGTDENKAFKVMLVGALEGKAVGYFWDLHVQREGNMLVVQEGTMIGAVPPQKRGKKPPFSQRRGGGRRSPGGPGGPPRKRWQNRDGQQRPARSGGSDRPTPPQNRENRAPSPRPIKRRNLDKPES